MSVRCAVCLAPAFFSSGPSSRDVTVHPCRRQCLGVFETWGPHVFTAGVGTGNNHMSGPVCFLHGQCRTDRCGRSICGKLHSTLGGCRPVFGGGYAAPTLSSKRCQSSRKTCARLPRAPLRRSSRLSMMSPQPRALGSATTQVIRRHQKFSQKIVRGVSSGGS